MSKTTLKILRLNQKAQIPQYATSGSACFDLHSTEGGTIEPGKAMAFGTGLAVEMPDNHVLKVFSRSGHGFKHQVSLANGTGIIDADFRGEIKVMLINHGTEPFTAQEGDRIAQAMLVEIPAVQLVVVTELSESERGEGGFGSTGN